MESPLTRYSNLACQACRQRKIKCSRERPYCTSCLQSQRSCYYGRIVRSPLTRVHLTAVEKRLQSLEALFEHLLPNINVEEALESHTPRAKPVDVSDDTHVSPKDSMSQSGDRDDTISEAVPDEVTGFDWQEEGNSVSSLTDGMAALSFNPTGTGYLGSTAGVFFLRSLIFWLGTHRPPPLSPSTGFENVVLNSHTSQSVISNQVTNRLVDEYFNSYHLSYPFIHEASFRAQYFELVPRPPHRSWNVLLYTILAVGAWCSSTVSAEIEENLFQKAIAFGEDGSLFERADLTVVQALVILGNLSQKRNKPNSGWNFIGLATRVALSLGLHRELPEWNIDLLQREMRRRTWWGLYMHDSGASTTFGRPILLPGREAMDVKTILNISDDLLTPKTSIIPEQIGSPTIYSGMKAQSSFHVLSNGISNQLLSTNGVRHEEALRMNHMLDLWEKTLPSYFELDCQEAGCNDDWYLFVRARLWWRLWNLRITILRQILLRQAARNRSGITQAMDVVGERCKAICINASHSTILSIKALLDQVPVTKLVEWYSTYFLFHASLVMLVAIFGEPSSCDVIRWQADIDLSREVFRGVLQGNKLARRGAAILDHLLPSDPHASRSGATTSQVDPDATEFSWLVDANLLFGSVGWSEFDQGL